MRIWGGGGDLFSPRLVYRFAKPAPRRSPSPISCEACRCGMPTGSSPLHLRRDCAGRLWTDIHAHFHREGYALFTSCSLIRKAGLLDNLELWSRGIRSGYAGFQRRYGGRVQDAWKHTMAVRYAAADRDTLQLLSHLHGNSSAEPFQTINFRRGTNQPTHSDVVHFDTLPQRGRMAAAWVAIEDIHPDSGPLIFYPGSHRAGLWDFDQLGLWNVSGSDYGAYEKAVQRTIEDHNLAPKVATISRGTTFLWAASLLHGGSTQKAMNRTRLSQVTHYFFPTPDTTYFVPRYSPPGKRKHPKSSAGWRGLVGVAAQVETNVSFWRHVVACAGPFRRCESNTAPAG